jgi:hypothetical protein
VLGRPSARKKLPNEQANLKVSGLAKLKPRRIPELRNMRSKSGCIVATVVAKSGMPLRFVISNWTVETLSCPYLWTSSSGFSFRHPGAITCDQSSMNFSANAFPMPG